MKIRFALMTAMLAIVQTASASIDPESCREATEAYNSAVTEVAQTLKSYGRCVASSHAHHACTAEFSELSLAQDGFEAAISRHRADCR